MALTAARVARVSVAALLLSALLVVVNPGTAAACSCVALEPTSEADAVFVGRADMSASRPRVERSGKHAWQKSVDATFEVEKVYKGSVHERQHVILLEGSGASCGVEVSSAPVLIFGHRAEDDSFAVNQPPGVYEGNFCSIQPVEFVSFDLRDLGPDDPPISGAGPSARSPGRDQGLLWGNASVVGAVALVTMVLVGGWFVARRRFR